MKYSPQRLMILLLLLVTLLLVWLVRRQAFGPRLAMDTNSLGDELVARFQALQAQEYWRLKGLSADLVILNEHPVSYLDEMQARLTVLLDDGAGRPFDADAFAGSGLRFLRLGQRVNIRIVDERIAAITLATFPLE